MTVASRKAENVEVACFALASYGGNVNSVFAGVCDFATVDQAFSNSVGRFGPVDTLISGAADNFFARRNAFSRTDSR